MIRVRVGLVCLPADLDVVEGGAGRGYAPWFILLLIRTPAWAGVRACVRTGVRAG